MLKVQEVVVCDVCGKPAAKPITLSIVVNGKRRNFTKDLCQKDLDAYTDNARPSRPGRRSGVYAELGGTAAKRGKKRATSPKAKAEAEPKPEVEQHEENEAELIDA